MNEEIKTMVKELQQECQKEGVTVVCTLEKKGHVTNALVGDLMNIAFALAIQDKELDKALPIPARTLRAAGNVALESAPNKQEHTFVIDDLNDLPSIFERILRGEV
ncbi:hypothetical protein FAE01_RS07075 [Enterococcus hirae]|uniref:hypothetical protein n=1 Tax=Enterococcus faecium TaxID=1352 RepID=UPI001A017B0B|nr:hypothetical protein [Enterococcus faecium]EMF0220872.1 hypothetical protein [Enterococcus hirae]EMF0238495.1 hypothetical protein [Enterococcus hirae]EMF0635607.1 hypothetical protein [Enterococcus faecium]MCL4608392.1 hypothetical protein [Enterococcus faecium]MCL4613598.1 hypothetical protein [Enterococcus faecium]